MEKLEGRMTQDLGIRLRRLGDLLYHEGPLLSHFVNEADEGEHYFYKWSDGDDTCNRWLIFKVSENSLKYFFEKKINLLQLIKQNSSVYFVDLDDELNQTQLVISSPDKIPTDYLPSENSLFQEQRYEKYAIELRDQLFNLSGTLIDIDVFDIFRNWLNDNLTTCQNPITINTPYLLNYSYLT